MDPVPENVSPWMGNVTFLVLATLHMCLQLKAQLIFKGFVALNPWAGGPEHAGTNGGVLPDMTAEGPGSQAGTRHAEPCASPHPGGPTAQHTRMHAAATAGPCRFRSVLLTALAKHLHEPGKNETTLLLVPLDSQGKSSTATVHLRGWAARALDALLEKPASLPVTPTDLTCKTEEPKGNTWDFVQTSGVQL